MLICPCMVSASLHMSTSVCFFGLSAFGFLSVLVYLSKFLSRSMSGFLHVWLCFVFLPESTRSCLIFCLLIHVWFYPSVGLPMFAVLSLLVCPLASLCKLLPRHNFKWILQTRIGCVCCHLSVFAWIFCPPLSSPQAASHSSFGSVYVWSECTRDKR